MDGVHAQKLRYNLLYCFLFFVHIFLINELKMKLSEHICYDIIEFYITVALRIVCKRITMKSIIKICF